MTDSDFYKAQMQKVVCVQLHDCEDVLLFSIFEFVWFLDNLSYKTRHFSDHLLTNQQ